VDIHFSQIMAATRNSTAANDKTVELSPIFGDDLIGQAATFLG
jgi:hypothetical protein